MWTRTQMCQLCVRRAVAPKKTFFLPHHHFPPFPFFALKICTAAGFLWGRCQAQNVFCNIIRSLLGGNIHYLRFCGPISPLFSKFLRSINCKIRGNEKCRMHLLPSKAARSTTFECRRNTTAAAAFFCPWLFFVSLCGKIRCRCLTRICVGGFTEGRRNWISSAFLRAAKKEGWGYARFSRIRRRLSLPLPVKKVHKKPNPRPFFPVRRK